MSIENEIADLTQSTTDLLNAVNTKKATLDTAVDTAEAAKAVATSKAEEATTVVANASTYETNAANSATQAAASAASANAIVTGVATGYPNIRPTLNLDFANSKTLDSRIDFTRSTTATYYDGKTSAKAEENLVRYSQEISQWTSQGVTITSDSVVAPDGTTTADTLESNGVNGSPQYIRQDNLSTLANAPMTFSAYLKAGTSNYAALVYREAPTRTIIVIYNLANGTVESENIEGTMSIISTSIEDVGNGWYRCSFVGQNTAGSLSGRRFGLFSTPDASHHYAGYYTGSASGSIYTWGAQVEQRDSLTAYTPTAGTPITNYVPVLQTAGIDEPRFDHVPETGESKGLLIEKQSTNLCAYSEDLSSGLLYNGSITVSTNLAIAPDGTLTADKVIPTGLGGRRGDHFTANGSMVEGKTYTLSGFYKADGSHYTRVKIGGVFGGESAIFDFDTGEFVSQDPNVTNTKAENVGNGWWRISVTYVFQNTINNNHPYALIAQPLLSDDSYSAPSYTGYNGVYVWGVQYEDEPFASSYIPTNGSAVTRAYDAVSMDFSSIIPNLNELSYVMSASKQGSLGAWSRYITIRDYANRNSTTATLSPSGNFYVESTYETSNVSSFYREHDLTGGQEVTFGASLKNNEMVYDTANSTPYLDSTGNAPKNMSLIYFGDTGSQHTKYFKLFSRAIAQSELEALTQE